MQTEVTYFCELNGTFIDKEFGSPPPQNLTKLLVPHSDLVGDLMDNLHSGRCAQWA